MINNKIDLKYYLAEDLKRYNEGKPTLKDWILHNEKWYIYHYIRHLRHMEYCQNASKNKLIFLWHFFRYKRLGFKLKISIRPNTIGHGLRIYHVGDCIRISNRCIIGKNCTLLPGVVFGNKYENSCDSSVTVGDNCYFGLGVKVFGPLTIGSNVTVGANSVITKNIPDNAVVGGVPARIIRIKE